MPPLYRVGRAPASARQSRPRGGAERLRRIVDDCNYAARPRIGRSARRSLLTSGGGALQRVPERL